MATTEQESREVAEAARETEWADKGFMREIFLGNLRIDWIHPFPETELRPKAREFYAQHEGVPRERGRQRGDRSHRRVPAAGDRGPAQARRLRHEDCRGVRRPRLQPGRVHPRARVDRPVRRERHRRAQRAPVDRLAAATQVVRHRSPEEEVPAALRQGFDQRVCAHRAGRRQRPGSAVDLRHQDARGRLHPERREALVHERHLRRALGGDGARSPDQEDQHVHRRGRLGRRRDRLSLPVHGPARARERHHPLQERHASPRRT